MAKSRRPGGAGSDLRSAFGGFLRSTLQQLDSVREVVVEKAKEGRAQLDLTLLKRKRKDALAKIGEAVVRLAHAGRITEDEFPEIGSGLAALEAIDERIAREEGVRGGGVHHADADDDLEDGVVSSASWRAAQAQGDREEYDDDDDDEEIADEDDDEEDEESP
jgi:hypothetical protein